VSLPVVFRETALRNLARLRGEDKDLFLRTRRAVAFLADQPYPAGAVAWGATSIYRLHAGDIRIPYEVDDDAATVYIINIGIISCSAIRTASRSPTTAWSAPWLS
jgi:mRNA-degrading endonuclease RelE of RelBE toxin-antitoxin system